MADERQAYASRTWQTGDVITKQALNNIENEMGYVSAEINNAVTGTINSDKVNDTIARKLDSVVKYFPNTPDPATDLEYVRMYAQPSTEGTITVPTEEEYLRFKQNFVQPFTNKAYVAGNYVEYEDEIYKVKSTIAKNNSAADDAAAWAAILALNPSPIRKINVMQEVDNLINVYTNDGQLTNEQNRIWIQQTSETVQAPSMQDFINFEGSMVPAYSASKNYEVGDYIYLPTGMASNTTSDYKIYKCTTSCNAAAWTTNSTNFTTAQVASDLKGEISQLKSAVNANSGVTIIDNWLNGYYIATKNSTADISNPTSSATWRCAVVDCNPGDLFTVNGKGTDTPRLWAFIDGASPANVLEPKAAKNASGTNLVIKAPADAVKLIINDNTKTGVCYKGIYLTNRVQENTDKIDFLTDEKRYSFTVSANGGMYIDLDIANGDTVGFDVLNVTGDYNYVQGYLYKSDNTYTNIYNPNNENKWYAGDSAVVTATAAYNRFRCYVFINSGSVTVDFAAYKVNNSTYTERIKQLEALSADLLQSSQALPVRNKRIETILGVTSMDDIPVNKVYYFSEVTDLENQPVSSMSGIVYSVQFNRSYNRSGILQYYADKEDTYFRESSGTASVTTWGSWQKLINVNNTLNRLTCKIFRKVICCGDSYTSGHIMDSQGTAHPSNVNYAWPHYMETLTGNTWYNCGSSGANCLTWQSREEGLAKALASGKTQAYVIGLGINDEASDTDRYVPVGTSADIGTNAQTYYGGISAIIRALAEESPDAFIFVNTNPNIGYSDLPARDATAYNEALRTIVQTYASTYKVHLIDLAGEYKGLYTNASLMNGMVARHFTASGYEQFAEIYAYVLSDYINKHVSVFNDVAFIPYDEN